jgi:RNA polymerase sigma factor (sigma-70 family)
MPKMTLALERNLVAQAQQGNNDAFAELYQANTELVTGMLAKKLDFTEHYIIEDLVQQTYLQAFKQIRTFKGKARFATWLYRIAFNNMAIWFRSTWKKQKNQVSLDELVNSVEDKVHKNEKYIAVPDKHLEQVPLRIDLERALLKLAKGQRCSVILKYIYGFDHKETARFSEHSVGTSKSQVVHARLNLTRLLEAK